MSEREAVERFVEDGDTVYAGFTHGSLALMFEIIRQGRRRLNVVGATNTLTASFLALAGCCDRMETGYMHGALFDGPIAKMMRDGRLRYDDYSNLTMTLRFLAGALGLPFIPSNSFLGTDYLTIAAEHEFDLRADRESGPDGGAPKVAVLESPFDGQKTVALRPCNPDVAVVHVQRADEYGNIQAWGPLTETKWAVAASKRIIASAEEIVPSSVIRSQPEMTLAPGFRVSAVVHSPRGAHPGSLSGYYNRDQHFFALVGNPFSSQDAAEGFLTDWVYGPESRAEYVAQYVERFGEDLLNQSLVTEPLTPERPAQHGWR